jgi:hypothetical protein
MVALIATTQDQMTGRAVEFAVRTVRGGMKHGIMMSGSSAVLMTTCPIVQLESSDLEQVTPRLIGYDLLRAAVRELGIFKILELGSSSQGNVTALLLCRRGNGRKGSLLATED